MTELTRTLRTGAKTGLSVDSMLAAALMAEMINPSRELWLVSPWITDVRVIDNRHGSFDALFGDVPPSSWRLSDALLRIAGAGSHVYIITRPDSHNEAFLRRIEAAELDTVHVRRDADVHEKTLCGQEWLLTGSMNYTVRGMAKNDESVTYKVGGPDAGQARLDLARRWRSGA
ncbi:phospholipase D-like domain-containing protein DpdK [Streptomyces cellulosae]|uniref:phospholipase D-like domain-containing protein DpdK n=1 Tax=Streptomyces TaxID=1883 RepID=UPI001F0EE016|nr:phospholipase D-like domain-containing protein DpdK [Streptomyces sp. NBC_00557]WSB91001.1 phospholipase D-like domain-containing protein DpdK [Streptomyces cellulosae]WTB49130.1 phospholipase D-like domain-containing protein DpdK [Streptomyces althioticus]WUC37144.1 phospholipase D-like domain-containing protein DpdK [Streptomyces sp. NBC_00557]